MVSFGSSVLATGAIDGNIFVAHTTKCINETADGSDTEHDDKSIVRGIRLNWEGRQKVHVGPRLVCCRQSQRVEIIILF